jgi:hypothetical protein
MWNVGDRSQVFYDPANPTYVVADTWLERWGTKAVFLLAGVLFAAVGAFGMMTRRQGSSKSF